MAEIRTFRALRPAEHLVSKIAALPYDVYSSSEARKVVEQNPHSFLKIDRAETQFPEGTDMYSQKIYDRARETLVEMEEAGEFLQEEKPCYYIYAQTMEGRTQTGLVCLVSIDDYLNQVVKKHENTREEKEQDRIRHVETCDAHTGPVFLAYRGRSEVKQIIESVVKEKPLYDFGSMEEVRHQVWRVDDDQQIEQLTENFRMIPSLYIADGHHRAAAAVKVGLKRRMTNPHFDGAKEFNYFLSVLFPAEELKIYAYNRVIHSISDIDNLMKKLKDFFEVQISESGQVYPGQKTEIGMYAEGKWYRLHAKQQIISEDPVEGLDVTVLQNIVLGPILGIDDPKTDERIRFVSGVRGLDELEKIVDLEGDAVAFVMYPTSMDELLEVADAGRLMPPKSTWFEPKLLSGLFIHKF